MDAERGQQKRKQYSLPGIFDTAEEAAELLAVIKRDMKAKYEAAVSCRATEADLEPLQPPQGK